MSLDLLEADVAALLTELSSTQDELLEFLAHKRRLLVAADIEGMQAMQPRELDLIGRLQACLDRRAELLAQAADQQLPSDSIRSLTSALPPGSRKQLAGQVAEAAGRADLLRHHSLTNWVLTQRTLLHLSQLLEIIATGGRRRPTYGDAPTADSSGALVDRAA